MTSLQKSQAPSASEGMGLFERYLSVWVALAIVVGVLLGQFAPAVPVKRPRFSESPGGRGG